MNTLSADQATTGIILVATMAMFLWGRWRHDLVALGALLACVFTGLVPGTEAFAGFGHPAVITVACVLVLGYGLLSSGAVHALAGRLLPTGAGPTQSLLALISLAALLSAFMNNVGALALLMPIGIQMASKLELPPGKILMPLAFGSILGGMTTLIGTPPNLIVSGFRETSADAAFGMFDFTPVGLSVAVLGIAFIGLVGWRIVPSRKQTGSEAFESGTYLSEVRVPAGSKAAGKNLSEVETLLDEADAQIVSMIRNEVRIPAPNSRRVLNDGDILVIEVEPASLGKALSTLGLELVEDIAVEKDDKQVAEPSTPDRKTREDEAPDDAEAEPEEPPRLDEVTVQELVVMPNSALEGGSALSLELRTRFGINLLAISRQGRRTISRLRSARFQAGDVLLMQGPPVALTGFASEFGCLPLATRDIHVPRRGKAITAGLVMLTAIVVTAAGLFPAVIAFAAAMFAYITLRIVPLRSVYTVIDWPVVVLLAAMLPVAGAIESTGTADLVARVMLDSLAQGDAIAGLVVLLVVTMFLSDMVNNAATAALMCPIAISAANQLGVSADAYLMAVAIGASCAFLTPIGHQNNTLILGPGGFRFGDFWRLGILLEIIVVVVSVPVLLLVWPL